MGFEDKKLQRQRHKRSKSCNVPENKKLEDDNIIDSSMNASQHFKLDLPHFCNKSVQSSLKQEPATELIKEIAVLELEVSHLEHYLLSLYRKAFDQQTSPTPKQQSLDFSRTTESRCFSFDNRLKSPCLVEKEPDSPNLRCRQENSASQSRCFSFDNRLKEPGSAARQFNQENSRIDSRCFSFDNRLKDESFYKKEDIDSCVRRCQSSLNQCSTFNNRISPSENSVFACHSQPLSIKEYIQNGSSHIFMTPNKLSEEMIKCASAIYSKLADPPLINRGFSSPSSSPSSTSEFSPHDMWSPSFRKNSSFDDQLEFSGPYSSMIEVSYIHQNHKKGRELDLMNQNFSLLIKQLENVDPRKLTHQEKLAFWINIHNSLVMHTFLANGIQQNNNAKRILLLSKPAYIIGGRIVSVEAIQSYILRIRMPRPGHWLKLLHIPRKFRAGDEHQEYSLDHFEPLLYFALCSGNHSDPAIRVYTHKRIYQELETAKEEYIRAMFGVKKDQKLVLPKIIECFSKDSGLSHTALMEMIQECLPETMKKTIKRLNSGRSRKSIVEWTPHSFVFRFLIAREVVR